MSIFSPDDLQELLSVSKSTCVSMYMPLHPGGDTHQNPIRFKNLVRDAERQLKDRGFGNDQIELFMMPAVQRINDLSFLRQPGRGLAVFMTSGFFKDFALPSDVPEFTAVSDHFNLKPLLPYVTENQQFYILTLSQKNVRFLRCDDSGPAPVPLKDIPTSLEDALRYDKPHREVQFHTGGGAVFHGQELGGAKQSREVELFFKRLDRGLQPLLSRSNAPLVLAGVDRLISTYRHTCSYKFVLEKGITGSPDARSDQELYEEAKRLVEPYFMQKTKEAIERYQQLAGTEAKRVAQEPDAIVTAANQGKIEELLLKPEETVWGSFDAKNNQVALQDEATAHEDLVDTAAFLTALHGGTVYALPPDSGGFERPMSAVLRY